MIQALGITPRHVSEYPPWGPPQSCGLRPGGSALPCVQLPAAHAQPRQPRGEMEYSAVEFFRAKCIWGSFSEKWDFVLTQGVPCSRNPT